jgi:hypothetical protein
MYKSRITSVCMSALLATYYQPASLPAQTLPVPVPKMNIVVVEGEAHIWNIRQRKAANIVVVVRDGNRNHLPGVPVTFTLPASGPSAVFPDGERTTSVTTDKEGYAVARGIRSNNIPGPYLIDVEAKHNDQTATARITQFNMNVESSKGGSGKWLAVLGIAGAAAAGGTVAALRKSSSTSPAPAPTPIGIAPGPGTVGPPR